MKKIILVWALLMSLPLFSQITFEEKISDYSDRIQKEIQQEKSALKAELELINQRYERLEISKQEFETLKQESAQRHAKIIEQKMNEMENGIQSLVQEKVNTEIDTLTQEQTKARINISIRAPWDQPNPGKDKPISRTDTKFVFAIGINNAVKNYSISEVNDSPFKTYVSRFWEIGFVNTYRLSDNSNLFHLNYGLSLHYNNLRPNGNLLFVKDGNYTNLEEFQYKLKKSRFKNVYLVLPLHLEMELGKTPENFDKARIYNGFRLGVGGFAGLRIKTKQKYQFYNESGHLIKRKNKGDFNTNDFTYGLSAYIGYKNTTFYTKYDLQPMFTSENPSLRNISFGIRFDL